LAYCIVLLQPSEEAGTEPVNAPVDPDGEVQLFNEVKSSATQIEVETFKYTVVCIELLTKPLATPRK